MKQRQKYRDPFWAGYKEIIRRYGGRDGDKAHDMTEWQKQAVQKAIERTLDKASGEDRLRLVDMVFWRRTHKTASAADVLYIGESTARRWHNEFVRLVGTCLWEVTNVL